MVSPKDLYVTMREIINAKMRGKAVNVDGEGGKSGGDMGERVLWAFNVKQYHDQLASHHRAALDKVYWDYEVKAQPMDVIAADEGLEQFDKIVPRELVNEGVFYVNALFS